MTDANDTPEKKCQSPINIDTNKTIKLSLDLFDFDTNYRKKQNATIVNTGHKVEIEFVDESRRAKVSKGGLEGEYFLKKISFHWPSNHTINNQERHNMEVNFVHYSTKCENYDTALNIKGGIAIMAVFYQFSRPKEVLDDIIRNIPKIAKKVLQPVNLDTKICPYTLLTEDILNYFRYNGSLFTTPYSDVIWTVFFTPSHMSSSQFEELTQIFDTQDQLIESNNKDVEDLNEREVISNCFCGKKLKKTEEQNA